MKYRKRFAIIFLFIVLAVLIVLAGSLSGIILQPGQPFPFGWDWNWLVGTDPGILPGGELLINLIEIILLCGVILLPFSIIYLILSPTARKQLVREFMRVVPILLLFIIFAKIMSRLPNLSEKNNLAVGTESALGLPSPTPLTYSTNPPPWLVLIITVSLAFVLTGSIFGGIWFFWKHRQKKNPMKQLAIQVERALDALYEGGDLKNIVIHCYYEMSQVLNQQRGIRREIAMTPQEFEKRLKENGFPELPIHQITMLFEEVRYGTLIPGVAEENRAVASLTEIIEFCQNSA